MASAQQRFLSALHMRSERAVHARFSNIQMALLSDADTGHAAAFLERIQALVNLHEYSGEGKTRENSSRFMLQVGSRLERGIERRNRPNEDSLFTFQGFLHGGFAPARRFALFVVADGMGGQERGQEASQIAIESLIEYVFTSLCSKDPTPDTFLSLLQEGVQHANLVLYQHARRVQVTMGTTMTAVLVSGSTAYVAHVGDSRAYLYRQSAGLVQLTHDHSLVAALVDVGAILPEEIYTHPGRNQIYRHLGQKAMQEIDTEQVSLAVGDLLLLCSDGLWEMAHDPQIADILARSTGDPTEMADRLVQAALAGGGEDNISVIVAWV